jgi:two-component system phosphate regulon sensor histidine kinase PhoR
MLGAVAALLAMATTAPAAAAAALGFLALAGAMTWLAIRRATAPSARERAFTGLEGGAAPPHAAVVEALPDPILVISGLEPEDITGRRFVLANAAARRLLHIERREGLLVTVVRDPEVLEAVDEALFGGLDSERVYEIAGVQPRTLRAYARPLGDKADGTRLALLMFRDETEARRVERTRADFLANASHELRTPLASLAGFIETLRGHARDDAVARDRFLGIMHAQAERMGRLIEDLMSLSRIELNEYIAPGDVVDLRLAVTDVIDALTPLAHERRVTLAAELPEAGLSCIRGDRDQIVQVVQNLVDNALKYSPPEGVVRIFLEIGLSADFAAAGQRTSAARLSL